MSFFFFFFGGRKELITNFPGAFFIRAELGTMKEKRKYAVGVAESVSLEFSSITWQPMVEHGRAV